MITVEQIRYNNLDLIYSNLSFAYLNSDASQMRFYFEKFQYEYPEYFGQMDSSVRCVFYENNCTPGERTPIQNIFGSTLKFNIEGCLRAIKKVLDEKSYFPFSIGAIQALYYPKSAFTPTYELYPGEYLSQQNIDGETPFKKEVKTLRVSDLLSVADYSIKILDTLSPNEKTQEISDTITILKGVDLALNNKPQDKPLNKSLHIVNSVLSSTVRSSLKKNTDKQFVGTMSVLLDLVIDFFCKK